LGRREGEVLHHELGGFRLARARLAANHQRLVPRPRAVRAIERVQALQRRLRFGKDVRGQTTSGASAACAQVLQHDRLAVERQTAKRVERDQNGSRVGVNLVVPKPERAHIRALKRTSKEAEQLSCFVYLLLLSVCVRMRFSAPRANSNELSPNCHYSPRVDVV
jgi:hypothetical protein